MTYRDQANACPRCGVSVEQLPDRRKWRCKTCSGVLVGLDELAAELADVDIKLCTAPEDVPSCPLCGGGMQSIDVLGVLLDRCETDRVVWFDPGELGRIRKVRQVDGDPAEQLRAVMRVLLG